MGQIDPLTNTYHLIDVAHYGTMKNLSERFLLPTALNLFTFASGNRYVAFFCDFEPAEQNQVRIYRLSDQQQQMQPDLTYKTTPSIMFTSTHSNWQIKGKHVPHQTVPTLSTYFLETGELVVLILNGNPISMVMSDSAMIDADPSTVFLRPSFSHSNLTVTPGVRHIFAYSYKTSQAYLEIIQVTPPLTITRAASVAVTDLYDIHALTLDNQFLLLSNETRQLVHHTIVDYVCANSDPFCNYFDGASQSVGAVIEDAGAHLFGTYQLRGQFKSVIIYWKLSVGLVFYDVSAGAVVSQVEITEKEFKLD